MLQTPTYRGLEAKGRIQSALQQKTKSGGGGDDNARLAEHWRRKAEKSGQAFDQRMAERFAELAKGGRG